MSVDYPVLYVRKNLRLQVVLDVRSSRVDTWADPRGENSPLSRDDDGGDADHWKVWSYPRDAVVDLFSCSVRSCRMLKSERRLDDDYNY
jgi:arabinogalactan endo-1,4-beta-galactosidase